MPLVQTMHVTSDGDCFGRRAGANGAAPNAPPSSVTGSSEPAATPSGTVAPSPTTVTPGSVRAMMLACSRGPSRRLIAEVIAPARSAPA